MADPPRPPSFGVTTPWNPHIEDANVRVNSCSEGNAPLTVQALSELLRSQVPLGHRFTAENADIVAL
jgi:hypothetical protein